MKMTFDGRGRVKPLNRRTLCLRTPLQMLHLCNQIERLEPMNIQFRHDFQYFH